MHRALTFPCLTLLLTSVVLAGCAKDPQSDVTSPVKDGLIKVGQTVQSVQSSTALHDAVGTTKEALTTTGETVQAGAEVAEDALTRVGNATVAVGQATSNGLTAVGNTVLEIKANLTPPPPPATPAP